MNYDLKTVWHPCYNTEHKDHCKGVPDALTAGQEVFATKGTIDGLGIKSHRLNVITINVPFMSVILKFSF